MPVVSPQELALRLSAFRKRMGDRLGRAARRQARAAIKSRTLRRSMRTIVEPGRGGSRLTKVRLFIPDYWAEFYHDGRGAQRARRGKKLVFFPNPKDDPRLRGTRPQRRRNRRKLTKAEFDRFQRINKERRERGADPIMVVTDRVGPSKGAEFFTKGMRGFDRTANKLIGEDVSQLVRELGLAEVKKADQILLDL